uniref:Neuregulin 2b n=1 Tax=Fundulus heteroclitus TaxID=8078 RepID=A0A3Q2PN08_FUNHE
DKNPKQQWKDLVKCEASGNPSPSFRWYKDGHELQKGRDLKIKTNKKNSKVQIGRVRVEDSGNYTCVAENSLGQENATTIITVQILTTTTLSPGVSHVRRCNDSEKAYCANGGDFLSFHQPSSFQHIPAPSISPPAKEEFYQRQVLTITGICVALLVVGIVCVVAYCKTKKRRNQMQNHLHQNQNQFVEQPNRMLANGPNHPGPGPEEIPMVDVSPHSSNTQRVENNSSNQEIKSYQLWRTNKYTSGHRKYVSALTTPARLSPVEFHYPPLPPQVPTFQITSPNTSHALSLPPAAAAYHRDDDQPLLRCPEVYTHLEVTGHRLYRQPRRPRRPYLTESTGSLPSSPYHLPDDEAYETTQEYASSREPIRSRRRPRRSRLNGHTSQRSAGYRDYSSQSFSQSDEEEEEDEDGHGESTPFLSMQNMNMDLPLSGSGYRSSSGADTQTQRGLSRPGVRSNGQSRGSQSQRSKADMPL